MIGKFILISSDKDPAWLPRKLQSPQHDAGEGDGNPAIPAAVAADAWAAEIFDGGGFALYMADAAGSITWCNAAAAEIWGRRPPIPEAPWWGGATLLRTDGTPLALEETPVARALKEDRCIRASVLTAGRADEGHVPLLWHASPMRDRHQQIVGVVSVLVDLTKQKNTEARVRGAAVAKTRFLSAMSHEFRTPIHGILGYADLLADAIAGQTPLGPDHAGWIDDLKKAGLHLLELVDDAISFSDASFAAARPIAARRASRLGRVVSDAVNTVQGAFRERGVAIILHGADPALAAAIDPPAARQALLGVLREVVRHMPEGNSVVLSWGVSSEDGLAFISLRCPGLALPPELLEQLHLPFAGADRDTYARGLEGAGLSVAAAAETLRGYNGQLAILGGMDGVPVTFRLAVPVAREGGEVAIPTPAPQASMEPRMPGPAPHASFSLAQVVAAARDIILVTAADLDRPGPTIVYVNPAFTTLTGYAAEEVLGRSPRILQGPGTDLETLRRVAEDLSAGREARATVLNYTRSGEPYHIEMYIVPLRNGQGRISHFAAIERVVGGAALSA